MFQRYGIVLILKESIVVCRPYDYFGTKDPSKAAPNETLTEWYHRDCYSWLELPREPEEAEAIEDQLQEILADDSNEAELSFRAKL